MVGERIFSGVAGCFATEMGSSGVTEINIVVLMVVLRHSIVLFRSSFQIALSIEGKPEDCNSTTVGKFHNVGNKALHGDGREVIAFHHLPND